MTSYLEASQGRMYGQYIVPWRHTVRGTVYTVHTHCDLSEGVQCGALCAHCAGHCALSGDIQCAALYALCVHTVRCVVTYSTKYCAHCVYTLCYLTDVC